MKYEKRPAETHFIVKGQCHALWPEEPLSRLHLQHFGSLSYELLLVFFFFLLHFLLDVRIQASQRHGTLSSSDFKRGNIEPITPTGS